MFTVTLIASFAAFTVSASAGLGGSLILIPILVILLGAKPGIALAGILLAANNVAKVIAYRRTIPWRSAALVLVLTMAGAFIGAQLLLRVDEFWIQVAVALSIAGTLVAERMSFDRLRLVAAPPLAFLSGATSGFSGTSGPLKGIALRNLDLDRAYLVGAASAVSLAGDATKATVFIHDSILSGEHFLLFAAAVPLMPVATWLGRRINRQMGERAYAGLFWTVMAGYTVRLLAA